MLLTASLAPYRSGSLTTDGESITFSSSGTTLGSASLRTGVASISVTLLPSGANSIVATYMGDTNFAASTSAPVGVSVAAPSVPSLSAILIGFAAQAVTTTSPAAPLKLTNTAAVPLTITSIMASGDFAQTNTCGSSLAAGASCSIAVTFTATATGTRTGTLTMTDNAATPTQTVALSGISVLPVSLAFTTSSLSITRGSSSQATIQVQAASGYTGSVSLSCAVSYQGTGTPVSTPTCTVNPAA